MHHMAIYIFHKPLSLQDKVLVFSRAHKALQDLALPTPTALSLSSQLLPGPQHESYALFTSSKLHITGMHPAQTSPSAQNALLVFIHTWNTS